MIKSSQQPPPIRMEIVTDLVELAKSRAQDERFQRNWDWFKARCQEIYTQHRGKIICVAGRELFVADSPKEVVALAKAAHPDDDGKFTMIIPQHKYTRIYASRWLLALVR